MDSQYRAVRNRWGSWNIIDDDAKQWHANGLTWHEAHAEMNRLRLAASSKRRSFDEVMR